MKTMELMKSDESAENISSATLEQQCEIEPGDDNMEEQIDSLEVTEMGNGICPIFDEEPGICYDQEVQIPNIPSLSTSDEKEPPTMISDLQSTPNNDSTIKTMPECKDNVPSKQYNNNLSPAVSTVQ